MLNGSKKELSQFECYFWNIEDAKGKQNYLVALVAWLAVSGQHRKTPGRTEKTLKRLHKGSLRENTEKENESAGRIDSGKED